MHRTAETRLSRQNKMHVHIRKTWAHHNGRVQRQRQGKTEQKAAVNECKNADEAGACIDFAGSLPFLKARRPMRP